MMRYFLLILFTVVTGLTTYAQQNHGLSKSSPESILLKDYRPKSIYNTPNTHIPRAKFPVVDMHTHPYAKSTEDLAGWVKRMDAANVKKSIVLTYSTGARFDSLHRIYSKFGDRFELWCGVDYTGMNEPGWSEKAVKELERCYKVGARGIGELGDKGEGELYSLPVPGYGMHIDDPRMKAVLKRCGELGMPVSIHVAEPMWMYEPMDSTNDGLMNAYKWRVTMDKPGKLNHAQLIQTLENAVQQNPATTFVACHLANCEYDLKIIGKLFDKYKNLYADFAARYAEIGPIPRYMSKFFEQYQDRLVYGTDMGTDLEMYAMTFRMLESMDEHFYLTEQTGYQWSCNGFGLPDAILKKIYGGNASKILSGK
jgi:predicted TIM-barrel fold metal-dependent hydrolase